MIIDDKGEDRAGPAEGSPAGGGRVRLRLPAELERPRGRRRGGRAGLPPREDGLQQRQLDAVRQESQILLLSSSSGTIHKGRPHRGGLAQKQT